MKYQNHRSSLGLAANILALLIYLVPAFLIFFTKMNLLSFILPFLLLRFERYSKFVIFHALQSSVIFMLFALFNLALRILILLISPLKLLLMAQILITNLVLSLIILVPVALASYYALTYRAKSLPFLKDVNIWAARKMNLDLF